MSHIGNIMNNPRGFATSYGSRPVQTTDMDVFQEIVETIRELNHEYNENIRFHHRVLEYYNQNINTSLYLLQVIINQIIHLSSYQPSFSRQRSASYGQPVRNTPRGGVSGSSPSVATAQRRGQDPMGGVDLSALIYLFTGSLLAQNGDGMGNTRTHVRPTLTAAQIENATETIHYTEGIGERTCPISMEEFTDNEEICRIRGCQHFFKRQSIMRWFENHVVCPLCRYDLRDFSNNVVPDPYDTTYDSNNHTPASPVSTSLPLPSVVNPFTMSSSQNTVLPVFLSNRSTEPGTPTLSVSETDENMRRLEYTNMSQILTSLLRNQVPMTDSSNNLLFTFEFPYDAVAR